MHTKINTHQNDSNFLTHSFYSKAKLGMQHIQLEQLKILSYAFTKKIKHISRINISDKHKIVVNSLEVHFGLKR
jgi:ribosome recycling factor